MPSAKGISSIRILFHIILLGLIFLAATARAESDAVIVKKLADIFRPYVAPLDRPLVVFHYQNEEAKSNGIENFSPASMAAIEKRTRGWPERFYNPELYRSHHLASFGLYTAIEPLNSRARYGHTLPQLYVFEIKHSTPVFDASSFTDQWAKTESLARLTECRDEVFENKVFESYQDINIRFWRNNPSLRCRSNFIAAFRLLNIQVLLIKNGWEMAHGIPNLRPHENEEFSIIDSNAIDFSASGFYSNKIQFGPECLAGMVKALYQEAVLDPIFSRYADRSDIPKTLASAVVSPEYELWKKEKIWTGGDRRKGLEDRPIRLFSERLLRFDFDEEHKKLMDQIFKIKVPTEFYNNYHSDHSKFQWHRFATALRDHLKGKKDFAVYLEASRELLVNDNESAYLKLTEEKPPKVHLRTLTELVQTHLLKTGQRFSIVDVFRAYRKFGAPVGIALRESMELARPLKTDQYRKHVVVTAEMLRKNWGFEQVQRYANEILKAETKYCLELVSRPKLTAAEYADSFCNPSLQRPRQ